MFLLTYHFPPASTPGALRWQKLAQYAVERGWELDVVTRDPEAVEFADDARLRDLPAGVRAFGVPDVSLRTEAIEAQLVRGVRKLRRARKSDDVPARPASLSRSDFERDLVSFRSWVRAFSAWSHSERYRVWARRAQHLAHRLFDPAAHRLVVSCGPPHMVHDGARRLARRTGLPFVMDLRDPWSLVERLPEALASPIHLWTARRVERRTLREASIVVLNTERARLEYERCYPEHRDKLITVMNGCDEGSPPRATRSPRFLIAYAGSIYVDRSPRTLFRATRRVVRELGLGPGELGMEFMGDVQHLDGRPLDAIVREEGLEGYVDLYPPGSASEAEAFLARASMLVSLPQDLHSAIPSKIFEYMRYDAWLLAVAERGSATEMLLRDTGARVVAPDDVDGLTATICACYREHAAGRRPEPVASDGRFSRRIQADRLFEAIEKIPSLDQT